MVDKSDLPSEIKNTLESSIRKKILLILYDEKERSAYSITNHNDINISISTVIEHLQKLEKAELIECKDASKGNLKRYHYKITKKGKHYLKEYYKYIIDDIKDKQDIANSLVNILNKT